MKSSYKIALIVSLLISFIACQKEGRIPLNKDEHLAEFKKWISNSGGIFSKEEIFLTTQSNNKTSGKLDWSNAEKYNIGEDEILSVPFSFSQSMYKNTKIYYQANAGELPCVYHLIFKKNFKGEIEGILRVRQYSDESVKGKRVFQHAYDIEGKHIAGYLTSVQGKHSLLKEESGYSRSSDCDAPSPGEEMPPVWWLEGGTGGYGYEEEETEYQNQRVIDSLNGYPCAQEILTQLPGLNTVADSILSEVFGIDNNTNIILKADPTLPNNVNAKRTPVSYINGVFSATINFNVNVLQYSAKEFIAATMFHEAIHTFIDYQIGRLKANKIDTNSFKQQFPIIWQYKNQGESGHAQIVSSYLSDLKDLISNYNSNLSTDVVNAIAWQGLNGTDDWRALGNDTIQIRQL